MKKLFVIFSLICTNMYAQSNTLDSVQIYFVELLNDYRKTMYTNIPYVHVDSSLNNAARHHVNYSFNMQSKNSDWMYAGHEQVSKTQNLKYCGTDTILQHPEDRLAYYDVKNEFVYNFEVNYNTHNLHRESKYFTNKKLLARKILQGYLSSAKHKQCLDQHQYQYIGINIAWANRDADSALVDVRCVVIAADSRTSSYFKIENNRHYMLPFYGNKIHDVVSKSVSKTLPETTYTKKFILP